MAEILICTSITQRGHEIFIVKKSVNNIASRKCTTNEISNWNKFDKLIAVVIASLQVIRFIFLSIIQLLMFLHVLAYFRIVHCSRITEVIKKCKPTTKLKDTSTI